MTEARHYGTELFKQREKVLIHEDNGVLGMVGNVSDLVRRQAKVQRVQHGAVAGRAQIHLQMGVRVPRESRDPVSRFCSEFLEDIGQSAGAAVEISVRVTMGASTSSRHDLLLPEEEARPVENHS